MALAQAAAFTAPRVSSHLLCMRLGLWAYHSGNALFQPAGLTFRFGVRALTIAAPWPPEALGRSVILVLCGTPVDPRTC